MAYDMKPGGGITKPDTPADGNWDDHGKSLYIPARTGLYRIKLPVRAGREGAILSRHVCKRSTKEENE
jgi:hypothetical protein